MCPACMATVAVIFGSAISTGGLTAFVMKKFHSNHAVEKNAAQPKSKENHDGQH
jgi:hypothetical protein